ncbi:MAG: hypothetical protein IPL55_12100 [Saprospiraceae bacterium]|jgi:hypothetical protein|nr:hypothetical protein [Saprospiraceae bacterium]MBL0024181.1 hypothetical protein [Saprospiraceae bacterium]
MSHPVRNVLIVVGAILAGSILVSVLESLILALFTLPPEMNRADIGAVTAYIERSETRELALYLLIHALGAFLSGWIIGRFAASSWPLLAFVTGLIWTFIGVSEIVLLSHPLWYAISDTCVYLPMTILGLKLTARQI